MFNESSEYYDLIYGFKDYKTEAEKISGIIRTESPSCKTILDIGCGTAEHHRYLSDKYTLSGIDINKAFVARAKEKNPGFEYHFADMSGFNLGKKYDVILCLFSSIGYLSSTEQLASALSCFASHLNKGGLVLLEPWFTEDNYHSGAVHALSCGNEEVKVTRMSHSYPQNGSSVIHFHYMIGDVKSGVRYFSETHYLKMFSETDFSESFRSTGFECRFEPKLFSDRGLYIAKKL